MAFAICLHRVFWQKALIIKVTAYAKHATVKVSERIINFTKFELSSSILLIRTKHDRPQGFNKFYYFSVS